MLNQFESDVLAKLLEGDKPELVILREQLAKARVSRKMTGVGFYLEFTFDNGVPRLDAQSLQFGDVEAEIKGLEHGAGFLLFVRDGLLLMLEAYTYDEPWPAQIESYKLRYHSESERQLPF